MSHKPGVIHFSYSITNVQIGIDGEIHNTSSQEKTHTFFLKCTFILELKQIEDNFSLSSLFLFAFES